jgi:hypothetical protein
MTGLGWFSIACAVLVVAMLWFTGMEGPPFKERLKRIAKWFAGKYAPPENTFNIKGPITFTNDAPILYGSGVDLMAAAAVQSYPEPKTMSETDLQNEEVERYLDDLDAVSHWRAVTDPTDRTEDRVEADCTGLSFVFFASTSIEAKWLADRLNLANNLLDVQDDNESEAAFVIDSGSSTPTIQRRIEFPEVEGESKRDRANRKQRFNNYVRLRQEFGHL